jgi:hypothetical protein
MTPAGTAAARGQKTPAQSAFRERIVLVQGAVIILTVIAVLFLSVRLNTAYSTNACNVASAAKAAATQDTRAALGNEGRAAAAALANSVTAAAASPAGIRGSLITTAEKAYGTTMATVTANLAASPVLPPAAC